MSLSMQPLAASPWSACAAADGAGNRRTADEARAHRGEQREGARAPKGRHALLAALTDALEGTAGVSTGNAASAPTDESSPGDRESKHALHAFVHELFGALRPAESEGRTGRGFAWGRTSAADLAQRLDALVQSLQGGAAQAPSDSPAVPAPEIPAPAPTTEVAPSTTGKTATATPTGSAGDASAMPPAPSGGDPLRSAFQQLLAVRHPAGSGGVTGDGIDALVDFLQRMSQSLAGRAASSSPVPGTLLDATA